MRPLVLSINAQQGLGRLEHRDGHVEDRRPDLWSPWRTLQLVVRPKAVELSRTAVALGRPVQPQLVFENADMDFFDDRRARHGSRNHRRRFGILRRAPAEGLAATRVAARTALLIQQVAVLASIRDRRMLRRRLSASSRTYTARVTLASR